MTEPLGFSPAVAAETSKRPDWNAMARSRRNFVLLSPKSARY
jgi:hypothetical protein